MKVLLILVISIFITFLSLPTIFLLIDKEKIDFSITFNMSEEEEIIEKTSFKVLVNNKINRNFIDFMTFISKLIISGPDNKYLSVLDEFFSPPPEI